MDVNYEDTLLPCLAEPGLDLGLVRCALASVTGIMFYPNKPPYSAW